MPRTRSARLKRRRSDEDDRSLTKEFENEGKTTRKHFERLPNDKLDWRPHQKLFTADGLASHIVECIGWADSIFTSDEFDFDPATYPPYQAGSTANLLKAFDDKVRICRQILDGVDEESMMQPWRLKMMGRLMFEKTRADVFRDFTLST